MGRLGPFERQPHLAVGCSGGADSLALTTLLADWIETRGGKLTALIVDHGLRPEAAAEAAQVRRQLRKAGIAAVVLAGSVPRPRRDVQNAARDLRYGLMSDWCRSRRVLHLLLAHHMDDQAETILLRLGRGSGVDGLAAMAPVTERPDVRLLRPLLSVSKSRLLATCRRRRIEPVVDPSNADPAYARVRMRRLMPELAREGMSAARLSSTAARMARARAALERAATELLGETAALFPAGYCRLDRTRFAMAPDEVALRALARLFACLSGADYAPRLESLERLWQALRQDAIGRGRTLAGVRILEQGDAWLVLREQSAMQPAVRLDGPVVWDGRFLASGGAGRAYSLGALGQEGLTALRKAGLDDAAEAVPRVVRPTLPALWSRRRLVSVPHLALDLGAKSGRNLVKVEFLPKRSLGEATFNFS